MKTLFVFCLLSVLSFALTGCGESHASVTPPEPVHAAIYKAGHGVQLTKTARTFISLETGEVASRSISGSSEVTAIPAAALLRTVKGEFVYVANGEWFLRTPVVIGAADASHVEIKDGLYEGDTIVVKGVRGLSLAEIQALNGGVGCTDGH